MFYPEKMCRVTIAAPKKHMRGVINTLYSMKALHIESYVPKDMEIGSPMKDAEKVSELLLDIEFIKSHLNKAKAAPIKSDINTLKKAEKFVKKLRSETAEVASRIKAINEKINLAEKAESDIAFLRSCGIKNLGIIGEYQKLDVIFGYRSSKEDVSKLKDCIVFSGKSGKMYPVTIFFRKGCNIREMLSKMKFCEIKINTDIPQYDKEALDKEHSELQKKVEELGKSLPAVMSLEKNLLSRITKAEAPLMFACSEYAFIVQGWVPEKNKDVLVKKLHEISSSMFIKIEPAKNAPTMVSNPAPVKSFEFFLNLYSLPRYKEIDPSFLIFLTFPLFYGIMLGDIGYGLILLAAGLLLRLKVKSFPKALADVTIISSLSTIAFGYMFGEFFGAEQIFGYQLHPYIHRVTQVSEMILYSIMIGLVHLNIGFVFGFVNEIKHGMKHALGKLSWIGLEAGGISLLLSYMKIISMDPLIGTAVAVISVAGILMGEGFVGLIEIPTLVGNILSYARLAAIGLASASLAIVINESAGGLFHAGGFFIIFGILILLFGHAINLALGIIDSFLQSLRLHYVEMFTKFYKGSGKPYKPFGS